MANHDEPSSIMGLQCDCKCVDGMHHIAEHDNEDEEDLILELVIKLFDNIQMKRRLTFV